jgi:hypothetical protein
MSQRSVSSSIRLSDLKITLFAQKNFTGQGGGLSNTGCIANDDNTALRKFNRRD